eukprot:Pgem_evm1s1967
MKFFNTSRIIARSYCAKPPAKSPAAAAPPAPKSTPAIKVTPPKRFGRNVVLVEGVRTPFQLSGT